ncbi:hypothetical protein [Streptomyces olivochromogenes]|uniref:hypothetical protein n=1 Tax=Streptomyces olivochromogenes TaxID=1963 RepID=UPI001F35B86F|nr:hypothetical protein [Streptomyces olivochromogenes]MCF3133168.1 hypothetical protein [Streptomyces olivochromogenes]
MFTTTSGQPWWSLPIHPRERDYDANPVDGSPIAGSGRPYPRPVLPPEIAAREEERCGPYRDAFGLCTGCGSGSGGWLPLPALTLYAASPSGSVVGVPLPSFSSFPVGVLA